MDTYKITTEHPTLGVQHFEYTAPPAHLEAVFKQFQQDHPDVERFLISMDVFDENGACTGGIQQVNGPPEDLLNGIEAIIQSDGVEIVVDEEACGVSVVLAHALVKLVQDAHKDKAVPEQMEIIAKYLTRGIDVYMGEPDPGMEPNFDHGVRWGYTAGDFDGPVS